MTDLVVTRAELALAVCRWHHAHKGGDPVPCVAATTEANALFTFLTGEFCD